MTDANFEIMAVVNLTTDSFSDGGLYFKAEDAIKRIDELIETGADIIDLGAESTRPSAKKIPAEEEYSRLAKILDILKEKNYPNLKISIDTRKPEVARHILDNYDIALFNHIAEVPFDDELLKEMVKKNISYLGMQVGKQHQNYSEGMGTKEAVEAVDRFFKTTHERLIALGFKPENIILDPGVGYNKDLSAQLEVMRRVKDYSKDYNILMGVSRKSWIGKLFGIENPMDREDLSKMSELFLTFLGAKIIRTHNAAELARIRKVLLS